MDLEMINVGKVNYAKIKFNGVTVIAGENNTGKSTVGKMLFCIFHAFYKIEEQVADERIKSVSRVLAHYNSETTNMFFRRIDTRGFAKKIISQREEFLKNRELLEKEITNFLLIREKSFERYISQESFGQLLERIETVLKIDDSELRKILLRKRLEAEFSMKIGHLNNIEKETKVTVYIKDCCIDFEIIKNEDVAINNYISLNKEIIYMDDPYILDDVGTWNLYGEDFSHRQDMVVKLLGRKKAFDFTLVDELVVKKKLEKILKLMDDICDGSIVRDDSGNFIFQSAKLNNSLEMVNLSTGMKSFVILRRLLETGKMEENGILILDEPEIHLHPEWQLKFAECIVLIQKEFGINILLNTHSPYFLNAVEVYSEKYGIEKKCEYYLTDESDEGLIVKKVTGHTEEIYAKLASPLQKLEDLEYRNDNTI